MEDGLRNYNVVLSYSTYADDPADALETALAAIATRSGAFVEIFDGEIARGAGSLQEGELSEFPKPPLNQSEKIERLKALLDEAENLADELTNAEPDFRTSSRLSRIVDGIDVAREHLEGAFAPRNH